MSQSILVIRGEKADLIRIRRSINVEGITTTNLIYHEGELNQAIQRTD
jgi:nitrate reductase NapAB chaperone NapD